MLSLIISFRIKSLKLWLHLRKKKTKKKQGYFLVHAEGSSLSDPVHSFIKHRLLVSAACVQ